MSLGALVYLFSCVKGFLSQHQIPEGTAGFRIFGADLIALSDISSGLMAGIGLFVIFMLLVSITDREEPR